MKKLIITAIILLMSVSASYAAGKNKLTDDLKFGAGIGLIDLELSDSALLFYGIVEKPLRFKIGKEVNTAMQLRLGASTDAKGKYVKSSINYMISGLFKPYYRINKQLTVYGLGGLSYISIDHTYSNPFYNGFLGNNFGSSSHSDLEVSFGIGLEYEIDRKMTIAGELTRYAPSVDGPSLNLYYKF